MTTENLLDDVDPTIDPNKDYLAELVGEGKKFATEKDLARGKLEADLFVEKLKREQAELRADFLRLQDEYKSTASLKEIVDQLKNTRPDSHTNQPVDRDTRDQNMFDAEKAKEVARSTYNEMETFRKQEANYNAVKAKLQERFGSNYQAAVKQQIDALGISETRLGEMARNEPQILIKALGLDQVRRDNFETPPRNNQLSDNFAPSAGTKRDWNFYQKLRQKEPKVYYDPKTQVQMHKDAIALGNDFGTPA